MEQFMPLDIRYNLFNFAPSELSHSAFWAWVLQCLDADSISELAGPQRVASRFVNRTGGAASTLHFPVTVQTEVSYRKRKDRIDILVTDSSHTKIVIENKVKAIPSRSQLERYYATLKSKEENQYFVIMSTAFDNDVKGSVPQPWKYLGIDDLIDLVKPDQDSHPLLSDYVSWLTYQRDDRMTLCRDALTDHPLKVQAALKKPEGQWELMRVLTSSIPGHQYRGTNLDGTPWTQFRFLTGDDATYDHLLLRIDSSSRGPYLSVKQYQKPPKPSRLHKQQRRDSLRKWWSEAVSQYSNGLIAGRPSSRGVYESEIGVFGIAENAPTMLQKELPEVLKAFTSRLSKEGWPVSL